MRLKRAAMIVVLALTASPAALPAVAMVPYRTQRIGELRELANLPGLPERLREPIERVERIAEDSWRVTGGRCHVDVRFVRIRSPRDGLSPPRYQPRLGERVCAR